MSTIGHLLDGRDAALGAARCSGSRSRRRTRCCSRSRSPVTVVSIGVLGFLLAVTFVRYRTAWALGNVFEYPVWLICGFLVPLSLLPGWVRPISWVLAPTWGMHAIRESALGGTPLAATSACASALGAVYVAIGVARARQHVLARRARRATLSLT